MGDTLSIERRVKDMRRSLVLIVLLWLPRVALGVDLDEARHLLARTSFGGTPTELAALQPLSYEAAVDRLLNNIQQQPGTAPPAWVDAAPPTPLERRTMSDEARQALREQTRAHGFALKGWWYQEMLSTATPFTERMTLFWHNHFTSSLQKVKWPPLLYRQNLLLRQHAL